jgi:hypothetical protein
MLCVLLRFPYISRHLHEYEQREGRAHMRHVQLLFAPICAKDINRLTAQ